MKKLIAVLIALSVLLSASVLAESASPVLDANSIARFYNAALRSAVSELESESSTNSLKPLYFEIIGFDGEYYDKSYENITLLPVEGEDGASVMSIRFIDLKAVEHEHEIPVLAFAKAVDHLAGNTLFSEWLAAEQESGSIFEGAGFSIEYTVITEEEAPVGVTFTVCPL